MDIVGLLVVAVPVVIILGLVLFFVLMYNRLYVLRNSADATLGQVMVAMKKRLDMIEQLLGAVRGYTKYEREVFERIATLRAGLFKAAPGELEDIDRESRSILGNLMAVAEAYPELKASETVMKLMDAVVSVENEIARQRYTYNNVVQEFNIMQDTIPSNVVARALGMRKLEYLRFEEEAVKPPEMTGIGPP